MATEQPITDALDDALAPIAATVEGLAASLDALLARERRRTLTKAHAAASLDVSIDFFEEHIQPDLKVIYKGRKVLIPIAELQRWTENQAERTFDSGPNGQ
jgi:hypothetical protein